MGKSGGWLRQVAVVAVYALSYGLLRQVSFVHWFLPAGLRLLCLLFVPYRYWPAMIVGEMLPLAKISYDCLDQFGPVYALIKLFPPIVLAMPIVRWCRSRLSLFDAQHSVRMSTLLFCTLLVSMVTAVRDISFLYTLREQPPGENPMFWDWGSQYFLGNYLGILTVVPLALLIRDIWREGTPNTLWKRLSRNRLVFDGVGLLLPALVLLTWLAANVSGDFSLVARMAMFMPVAWMALRHGWSGVALAGSAASLCVALITPDESDAITLQAQVFISFAITTLLMLGARIATLRVHEEKERMDGQLALQLAQQGLYLGELRMCQTADALEQVGSAIQQSHNRFLERLRNMLSTTEERVYYRQAIATQQQVFRLADSIYPRTLQSRGFPSTLNNGPIAKAMDDMGIAYDSNLSGRGWSRLDPGVQIALYRLACEAVVHLFEQSQSIDQLRLVLRAGETHGRRWAVLKIDAVFDRSKASREPKQNEWEELSYRLGVGGLGLDAIRDRARIYGGAIHTRSTSKGARLSLLLHDTTKPDTLS
ncbi:MASE1 domain-containing protein [Dyella silvatica]|uniref:MASE1 domain-containing protein n=1 Tax=Dyella silvatica TaxID=2992128 RepID=UPI00224F2420|nr:MASE1 domain-containing protein [Dyella silvatica]